MSFAQYPSLQRKPVIVTGGASGIGEATVRAFAEQGALTGFVDMDAERGAALAAELGAAGHTALFARCDLREDDRIVVRRYARPISLLHPEGHSYYGMLREKLNWNRD